MSRFNPGDEVIYFRLRTGQAEPDKLAAVVRRINSRRTCITITAPEFIGRRNIGVSPWSLSARHSKPSALEKDAKP